MKCEELLNQALLKNKKDLSKTQLEHLSNCKNCSELFSQKEIIDNHLEQLADLDLKIDITDKVLSQLSIPEQKTEKKQPFHFLLNLFKPTSQRKSILVYGIMTLILVFTTFIAIRHIQTGKNKPEKTSSWKATTTVVSNSKAHTQHFNLPELVTSNFTEKQNAILVLPMRAKLYLKENSSVIPYPNKLIINNGLINAEIISNAKQKPLQLVFHDSSFESLQGKFQIKVDASEIKITSLAGEGTVVQAQQKTQLTSGKTITIITRSRKNGL